MQRHVLITNHATYSNICSIYSGRLKVYKSKTLWTQILPTTKMCLFTTLKYEPQHVISNNVTF